MQQSFQSMMMQVDNEVDSMLECSDNAIQVKLFSTQTSVSSSKKPQHFDTPPNVEVHNNLSEKGSIQHFLSVDFFFAFTCDSHLKDLLRDKK
jgi:hypothetical protein